MKRYFLDQIMQLIIGVLLSIGAANIYLSCNVTNIPIVKVCLFIYLVVLPPIVFAYNSRHIILIPLDLLVGKRTKKMYYSGIAYRDTYEFFRSGAVSILKFYGDGREKLLLISPEMQSKQKELPVVNEKVVVEYFAITKILLNWQQTE